MEQPIVRFNPGLGFRVQGSGFRVQGSGFRVQGSGVRVNVPGFKVQGPELRVQGTGYRLQGTGFRVHCGPRCRVQGPFHCTAAMEQPGTRFHPGLGFGALGY